MANKKISELTSATTPLAGTEELAIVQGGETKKVSASDLSGGGAKQIIMSTDYWPMNGTVNTWQSWHVSVAQTAMLSGRPLGTFGIGTLPSMSSSNFIFLVGCKKLKRMSFSFGGSSTFTLQFVVNVSSYVSGTIESAIDAENIVNESWSSTHSGAKTDFVIAEHELTDLSIIRVFFRKTAGGTTLINAPQITLDFE